VPAPGERPPFCHEEAERIALTADLKAAGLSTTAPLRPGLGIDLGILNLAINVGAGSTSTTTPSSTSTTTATS